MVMYGATVIIYLLPIDSVDFIQVVGCVAVYLWCTYRYSTTVLYWYEGLVYGMRFPLPYGALTSSTLYRIFNTL